MSEDDLQELLDWLCSLPSEKEWVEFKESYFKADDFGKYVSALSNEACLHNQDKGYLVFGVNDKDHSIVGTSFRPEKKKVDNQNFQNWLVNRLTPKVSLDFHSLELLVDGKKRIVVIVEVQAAANQPTEFLNVAYIRISDVNRRLSEFPEKARLLWQKTAVKRFEDEYCSAKISADEVIKLIAVEKYFELLELPLPDNRNAILDRLVNDLLLTKKQTKYQITNLAGITLARDLRLFPHLQSKSARVIVYRGKTKLDTVKDLTFNDGYAAGFQKMLNYINDQTPQNELLEDALRKEIKMYPKVLLREFLANSLVHQDFFENGGPVIEIYQDRVEFSNPGKPMVDVLRFIDEDQARNQKLTDLMRRLRICEQKGSGIDRAVELTETHQLPAPLFLVQDKHTKATVYGYKTLSEMELSDKIRACYQHVCLMYISNKKMTNQTLRQRFNIEPRNAAVATRIIKDTMEVGLIKDSDPESRSRKFVHYVPTWA